MMHTFAQDFLGMLLSHIYKGEDAEDTFSPREFLEQTQMQKMFL